MTTHEFITQRCFAKIRTAIISSLVILMGGCAGGGGGVPALLSVSPVPPAPTATAATTLPAQSSPPTTVNQTASTTSNYAAIVQTVSYAGGSGNPVTSITPMTADINATMAVTYSSSALPSALTISSSNVNGTVSQNQVITNYASTTVPSSVYLDDNVVVGTYPTGGNVMQNDAIDIVGTPTSATTATAFNYQSFGIWEYSPNTSSGTESAFSYGVPTTATLPTTGTADYQGIAAGAYIDPNGTIYATAAGMVSIVDFGARTIGFSTYGTTTVNATTGATATNTSLDLHGTLAITYNSFTGSVANTTGSMSGNATGLFYGPGIGSPTASSVAGSPAEMGGTYALTGKGGGMLGAFGGIAQ